LLRFLSYDEQKSKFIAYNDSNQITFEKSALRGGKVVETIHCEDELMIWPKIFFKRIVLLDFLML
tara:strand:+ start:161 stop:355 length:195 start_codon:yes stop_codon:yes gene_type:complete